MLCCIVWCRMLTATSVWWWCGGYIYSLIFRFQPLPLTQRWQSVREKCSLGISGFFFKHSDWVQPWTWSLIYTRSCFHWESKLMFAVENVSKNICQPCCGRFKITCRHLGEHDWSGFNEHTAMWRETLQTPGWSLSTALTYTHCHTKHISQHIIRPYTFSPAHPWPLPTLRKVTTSHLPWAGCLDVFNSTKGPLWRCNKTWGPLVITFRMHTTKWESDNTTAKVMWC